MVVELLHKEIILETTTKVRLLGSGELFVDIQVWGGSLLSYPKLERNPRVLLNLSCPSYYFLVLGIPEIT